MQRGSDKHSPRVDEQMKGEVGGLITSGRDTHAEEWKTPEPAGEDQPDVDLVPDGTLVGGVPAGMTETDVEGRTELARHLHRSVFPAVREVLIDDVMNSDAPDRIVDMIKALPSGREFVNVQDVWATLGGGVEERRA